MTTVAMRPGVIRFCLSVAGAWSGEECPEAGKSKPDDEEDERIDEGVVVVDR